MLSKTPAPPLFVCGRLGVAELAVIGLLNPFEYEDLPWSQEERQTLRRAAEELRFQGPDIPYLEGWADLLCHAQSVINKKSADWWPYVVVSAGLDGLGDRMVHDLTLPAMWGASWLFGQLEGQSRRTVDKALDALDDFNDQAEERLEALHLRAEECRLADDVPSLDEAAGIVSRAIAKVGPVLFISFGPNANPAVASADTPPTLDSPASASLAGVAA